MGVHKLACPWRASAEGGRSGDKPRCLTPGSRLKLLAKKAKRLRATAAAKTKALSRKRSSSSNDDRVVEVVDIMTAPPGPVLAPEGAGARKASTAEAPVVLRLPAPVPRSASDGDVGVNNSNS